MNKLRIRNIQYILIKLTLKIFLNKENASFLFTWYDFYCILLNFISPRFILFQL